MGADPRTGLFHSTRICNITGADLRTGLLTTIVKGTYPKNRFTSFYCICHTRAPIPRTDFTMLLVHETQIYVVKIQLVPEPMLLKTMLESTLHIPKTT